MTTADPSERLPTAREALRNLSSPERPPQAEKTSTGTSGAAGRSTMRKVTAALPIERIGVAALCIICLFLGYQGFAWFKGHRVLLAESRGVEIERQVIEEQLQALQAKTAAGTRPWEELEGEWRELEELLAGSPLAETVRATRKAIRKDARGSQAERIESALLEARAAEQAGDVRRAVRHLLDVAELGAEAQEALALLSRLARQLYEKDGLVVVPRDARSGAPALLVESRLARAASSQEGASASSRPIVNLNLGDAVRLSYARGRRLLKTSEWDRFYLLATGDGPSWARPWGERLDRSGEEQLFEWVNPDAADSASKQGLGACKGGDRPGVPPRHEVRRRRDEGYADVGVRFAADL